MLRVGALDKRLEVGHRLRDEPVLLSEESREESPLREKPDAGRLIKLLRRD